MLDGNAYQPNFIPDDPANNVSILAESLRRLNDPFVLMEALAALEVRTILSPSVASLPDSRARLARAPTRLPPNALRSGARSKSASRSSKQTGR